MAASHETLQCIRIAAEAARQLKATEITAIDVSERLVLTEAFLIVSGSSQRQVRALVDGVEEALAKVGIDRQWREGLGDEIHWVLVDFGDLIVHVLPDEDRGLYALDRLWADCPTIELDLDEEAPWEPGAGGAAAGAAGVGGAGAGGDAGARAVGDVVGTGAAGGFGALGADGEHGGDAASGDSGGLNAGKLGDTPTGKLGDLNQGKLGDLGAGQAFAGVES